MLLKSFILDGGCKKEFDTEIKFDLASAKYDGADLVKFSIKTREEASENSRLLSCVYKVLNSLKKTGTVKFYVKPEQLEEGTTEAEYITNKFASEIEVRSDYKDIYVKI